MRKSIRFRELETLLPALEGDQRRLAARLALLPLTASSDAWKEIKPLVCDGLNPEILDDLRLGGVLENAEPPSFGHAKRWDAARAWFIEKRKNTIKPEAEALVLAFASRIRDLSPEAMALTSALISLRQTASSLGLSVLPRGLCEAAIAFAEHADADSEIILRGAKVARDVQSFASLMAMGLSKTLFGAKAENEISGYGALFDELRSIANANPDDATYDDRLLLRFLKRFCERI